MWHMSRIEVRENLCISIISSPIIYFFLMGSRWYPEGQFIRLHRKLPRVFWHISSAFLHTWPASHSSMSVNTRRKQLSIVTVCNDIVTANNAVIARDRGDYRNIRAHRWPKLMLQFAGKRVKYKLHCCFNCEISRWNAHEATTMTHVNELSLFIPLIRTIALIHKCIMSVFES